MKLNNSDLELLARYARCHAEDAFSEVVRRHLDLVHSAALRQVRSPQLAEEVAQSTFLKLARDAHKLAPNTILTAWLYQVARRESIDVVRREARRQLREQIAVEMNAMNATADDWTQIQPMLDDAMDALDEADRCAVLLRYFENKSLREVGHTLGTTDDTARKRVNRAIERLREFFAKRGVTVGASGLVVLICANAVQAAPIGLAVKISTAAALAGTKFVTAATATAAKAIAMTTLQKTLVGAMLVAAVGTGIHEVARLRRDTPRLVRLNVNSAQPTNKVLTVAEIIVTNTAPQRVTEDQLRANIQTRSGDAYSRVAIDRDVRSLYATALFSNIRVTESRNNLGITLTYIVKEKTRDAEATPQIFQNHGMATPVTGFQTFLWAARNGDSNLLSQMLRWRKDREDTVSNVRANQIAAAQALGGFNEVSNFVAVRVLGPSRLRVEFGESNGRTRLREIYMIREGADWKPALNFSRREGSRVLSAEFFLPTTPELGPVDQ